MCQSHLPFQPTLAKIHSPIVHVHTSTNQQAFSNPGRRNNTQFQHHLGHHYIPASSIYIYRRFRRHLVSAVSPSGADAGQVSPDDGARVHYVLPCENRVLGAAQNRLSAHLVTGSLDAENRPLLVNQQSSHQPSKSPMVTPEEISRYYDI